MKLVNKTELFDLITRTYYSFWLWCFLTILAVINSLVFPSIFNLSVVSINVFVALNKYQEHKKLRAEYVRRYPWPINQPTEQFEETEQEDGKS